MSSCDILLIGDSMDRMDAIKGALNSNANLSNEMKENIYELVNIFHNKFADVDLNNLKNRLMTLEIRKLNKFLSNDVSMYNNVTNVLYFNGERLNNGYDARHVLMYEILNMISSTDEKRGFIHEGRFEALNVGFTEILANYLVGNDSDIPLYPEQAIETNLISIIIGSDVLKKAYFGNNTDMLIRGFADAGVEL